MKETNGKPRIAILTRPDYRSPRILAESLKHQVDSMAFAKVFYNVSFLSRLVSYRRSKLSFHFWLRRKLASFFFDRKIIRELKKFDAIIISECSPNCFWRSLYNIEKFKKIINKPVLLYEVYYLGNAPTQIHKLEKSKDTLFERYDWHLAVSEVTETRGAPGEGWSCVGLDLTDTGLKPFAKKEFVAVVDFIQEGYEEYHQQQLEVLTELGIKTVVLQGQYALDDIRDVYKKSSVFFLQFPEAFGLPIAECLACGVQIFTPSSGWPMSWRLDKDPITHGEGTLPEVFTVYSSKDDLKNKLAELKSNYDLNKTPFQIFDAFIRHYPHFYNGNRQAIEDLLQRIEQRSFT